MDIATILGDPSKNMNELFANFDLEALLAEATLKIQLNKAVDAALEGLPLSQDDIVLEIKKV